MNNLSTMQMMNTAIIQLKQDGVNKDYQQRLFHLCESEEMKAVTVAIEHLAKSAGITNDKAAERIASVIKRLDAVWTDFVIMEGIDIIKNRLEESKNDEA